MSDLDALLAGIVADPTDALRWLVMADWLEDHGQPERAELVRVHRELLRTCTATRETKARKQLHARMMELMRSGVQPCLPQRTITLPGGVEMRFSFIPPGSFLMGSPKSEEGRDVRERRHRATLTKGFWMGQTPVTQRQWVALMDSNPSHFKGDELPVDTVTWNDTQLFCAAAKARLRVDPRLPTEAEWEYMARAGTTTPFYWGAEMNGTQANCTGSDSDRTSWKGPKRPKPSPVGKYAPVSPHPWSLVDMHGNVWEWCADWEEDYPGGEATDPLGPQSGLFRVCRGGGWCNFATGCHAASRFRRSSHGTGTYNYLGFRLAADLSALA